MSAVAMPRSWREEEALGCPWPWVPLHPSPVCQPRTSHGRGPGGTPQQSTTRTSCHRTVPHHWSPVRGERRAGPRPRPALLPSQMALVCLPTKLRRQCPCGAAESPKKTKGLGGDKAACTFSQHRYIRGAKHLRRRLLPSQRSSGGMPGEEKRTDQGRRKQFTHAHARTPNSR